MGATPDSDPLTVVLEIEREEDEDGEDGEDDDEEE